MIALATANNFLNLKDDSDGPAGVYRAEKSVLGSKFVCEANFKDDSHVDITVSVKGLIHVDIKCKDEEYTIDGDNIDIPGFSDKKDCLGKVLHD